MKKYFLVVSLVGAAFMFLPQAARAQYTDPYYNSRVVGDMITRKTMEKAARKNTSTNKKKPAVKRKKAVVRKNRERG